MSKTFLNRHWKKPTFETQVLEIKQEISEIKEECIPSEILVIDKKEEPKQKTKKQKKKKTATDIHLKIKKILEESPDLDGHTKARSVLSKAFYDGYKGKRLDKWSFYLGEYFLELDREAIMDDDLLKLNSAATVDTRPKDGLDKYIEEREEKEPGFKEEIKKEKEKILEEIEEAFPADMGIAPVKLTTDDESVLPTNDERSIITELDKEKEKMTDLPDLPLEDMEFSDEAEDTSVQDAAGGSVTFGIIGAGQAGGRIAESFYKLGYKKMLAVNTAQHDLDGLTEVPEKQKVLMGTVGAGGAGKDMRKGEAAADAHQQEIYEKMQKLFGATDRIIVCMGAGGGTGAGSCLRLVETAKKYLIYLGVESANDKVGVLVALPTAGECTDSIVADNAKLIVTRLCEYANEKEISPLIIFDNDKIKKMFRSLTVTQFWPTINSTVTGLFHMFNVLATKVGNPTSFDPADYNRVLSAGGCMIMGMTSLKEYSDGTHVSKAIRLNLEKGLLCGGFDVATAKAAACIATASLDILENTSGLMVSLEEGFDTLGNITGNAAVFRGIYDGKKEKLTIYTMITGLSTPNKRIKELEKFQKVSTEKSKLYD